MQPANSKVTESILTKEELKERYGHIKPYKGPHKKPIGWAAQKLQQENMAKRQGKA